MFGKRISRRRFYFRVVVYSLTILAGIFITLHHIITKEPLSWGAAAAAFAVLTLGMLSDLLATIVEYRAQLKVDAVRAQGMDITMEKDLFL